jgi:tripartite ATP-independent transporter DctM subunit
MTGLEGLGMVMLTVMLGVIFVGFPISFTLLILALGFGYAGLGQMVFDLAYLQTIGLMKMEELAAVPLFIFMGYLTEQAGLMERLFRAFRDMLAPVRGALYLGVILTATVFAMATGIVGAAVTVLGIMAAPIMIKANYDPRMAAGSIAAGGTLGILIPPSVMLIVMGPVLGVSVADLYSAAFGPGFLLAGMYIVYTLVRSFINPKLGPPVPLDERPTSWKVVIKEMFFGMVPLGLLIACTLGSILMGLATPTEAASVGCFGAFVLALAYRRFTFTGLKNACVSTTITTSMVMFLAVTSNIFGAVFSRLGTAEWITRSLLALPLPPILMPARLAVRVARHHPGVPADLRPGGAGAQFQPGLVRRAGGGHDADGVPVASGGYVGLLPEAGGAAMEPGHHLQGDVRFHVDPVPLHPDRIVRPQHRDVAADHADRAGYGRTHGAIECGGYRHRKCAGKRLPRRGIRKRSAEDRLSRGGIQERNAEGGRSGGGEKRNEEVKMDGFYATGFICFLNERRRQCDYQL